MLTTTIPAYLYQEYADDDSLQAFITSYNQASQYYVDWFNTAGLPIYTGLSGDLLNWVARGLYGLDRTALATPLTVAQGPLNTEDLDTKALNTFIAPTQTFFSLTDDVFKRILTWDFYKGDGKRFTMLWLKRRVMRFLVGTNGVDPTPQNGFTVGADNTQAISVTVSGNVLTVTIYQTILQQLVQLSPGIINLFKLAFTGGVLDLPLQYTYVVNIVAFVLSVTVSPSTLTQTGPSTTQTTGAATVTAIGGSSSYTYAWTFLTNPSGLISITSPSAAATTFTATGMTVGNTYTALAKCTVTDTITSNTQFITLNVTFNCQSSPSLLLEDGDTMLTESQQNILLES